MYAHQVIEDMERYSTVWDSLNFFKRTPVGSMKNVVNIIRSAQKFNMGKLSGFDELIKTGTKPFCDANGGVKLPYDACWFDYDFDAAGKERGYSQGVSAVLNMDEVKSGQIPSTKRGVLAININDAIFATFFNYIKPPGDDHELSWFPSLVSEVVFVDSPVQESKSFDAVKKIAYYIKEIKGLNVVPLPNADPPALSHAKEILLHHAENNDEVKALNTALMLLSCRNIETIDNPPPEKLNKKRIKSGKQPLFTYKTLVIKPTGKQQQSIPKHLWENRIHLCRGHFKTYTEEAPLFGRLTGRYWWQPSVRGRNKEGVVMKDYKVVTDNVSHKCPGVQNAPLNHLK